MTTADASLIGRVRKDFVPATDYISPEFARLEFKNGVWRRTWQTACRVEDVANVGDFVTYDVGPESILVVRSAQDRIVAHHNVCQHRGRRLKNKDELMGNTGATLFCRYHGWRYGLDGRVIEVNSRPDWQGCPQFTDDDLSLRSVKVDTWGGWVWINMDPDAEPLIDYLGVVPDYLNCFGFEHMRTVWHQTIRVPANWKTVLEGFHEAYHAMTVHPQTQIFDERFGSGPSRTVAHGIHGQMLLGDSLEKTPKGPLDFRELFDTFMTSIKKQYHAMYFEPSLTACKRVLKELPPTASLYEVAVAHIHFARETADAAGIVWPPQLTLENMAKAGFDWHVFPNSIFLPSMDGVVHYRTRPDGMDPDFCLWDLRCLGRFAPGKEPKYQYEFFATPEAYKGKNLLMEQDLKNIVEVQAGMHSSGFAGSRTNPLQEATTSNFHRVLHDFIQA